MTPLNAGKFIQMGCGLCVVAVICVCGLISLFGRIQQDHSWDNARRTEEVIHAVETASVQFRGFGTKHSIRVYTVQFEYVVDEDVFRVSQSVTTYFFKGQRVPVIYLPDTPWVAEIHLDTASDVGTPIALLFMVAIMALIVRAMWNDRQAHNKQKRKEKPI